MKTITRIMPSTAASSPARIESAPRPGPTERCSITVKRRRQGAGAQQQRQVLRLLNAEVAADHAAAAEDRLADHRRRDHLVVEHDGEGPADVLLGHLTEALGAGGVEAEADHRLAVLKGRLGVGQVLAGDQDALAHTRSAAPGCAGSRTGSRRSAPLPWAAASEPGGTGSTPGAHLLVDHAEAELRGLAQQVDQPLRILHAGHLHQDALVALALDRGLAGAQLVDAPPHDLDRLLQHARLPLLLDLVDQADLARAAIAVDGQQRVADEIGQGLAPRPRPGRGHAG